MQPSTPTLTAEVHPFAPDGWVDYDKIKISCEIPFARRSYEYAPSRSQANVAAEIKRVRETER